MAGLSRENAVAEYHISAPLITFSFTCTPKGLLLRHPHTPAHHTFLHSAHDSALKGRRKEVALEIGECFKMKIQISIIKSIASVSRSERKKKY